MSTIQADRLLHEPRRGAHQRERQRRRVRRNRRLMGGVMLGLAIIGLGLLLDAILPGGASDPLPTISGPNTGPSSIYEGPGGRVALRTWSLRLDPGDVGEREGWAEGRFAGQTVTVPYDANGVLASGRAALDAEYYGSIAWYRTSFDVKTPGTYVVRFESVNFHATVWLDGHLLGAHDGEYLPFEFRIHAGSGTHTLVVRVDWRNPDAQSALGFHRTWFNWGGIDREVNVRWLGPSEIVTPTLQMRLTTAPGGGRDARVAVTMEVRNEIGPRLIAPSGSLTDGGQHITLAFPAERLAAGAVAMMTATATISDPQLWAPGSPNLYDLQLAVGKESSYRAMVGLRQLTWSGGRLYINGHLLKLHGASIQEDAPGRGDALTPADQDAIVSELKAIGANATRSQHPLDPGLLEKLDAAGILVWQGIGPVDSSGNWTSTTPALMAAAQRRVRASAREDQLHPSIIAWNLANEIGGDNGHPGGQAQYIEQATRWLHAYDPGRMVAVDVWGEYPPHDPGPLYRGLDAVSITDYAGWYDDARGSAASVASLIANRLGGLARALPGKVLLVSEFGAEANAQNPDPQLGSYAYQSQVLAENIGDYERDPALSGMLVWSLRDFAVAPTFGGGSIHAVAPNISLPLGLDEKGLFDYAGAPKPSEALVARDFKALGPY